VKKMVKYSYFPGCNLKTNAKGYEDSAVIVSKKLDAELVEMPKWNCCGTVHTMATDNLMKRIAPVRNLARAKKHVDMLENSPKEVVTLCSMCNSTLKIVNDEVKIDPSKLETINYILSEHDETYDGSMEVKHYLQILRDVVGFDKIRKKVSRSLDGFKVFAYYGCMLLHPEHAAIDDPEQPSIMEELVEALGAEAILTPYFKTCCGSYHTLDQPELVSHQVKKIVDGAKAAGANAIMVACPLCGYNLDKTQKDLEKQGKLQGPLPVFYFTQLMAIAIGEPLEINHFENNFVDPHKLLKELGIEG